MLRFAEGEGRLNLRRGMTATARIWKGQELEALLGFVLECEQKVKTGEESGWE